VRFLIDRCAGRRLAEWLRASGHDAVESRTIGPDPGDPTLLQWAVNDRRILITIDTDFGKLLFVDEATCCGLVRLPDVPANERIELMEEVLGRYSVELEAGAVVTVCGRRIRVSEPPRRDTPE
jgi:predicted nuclease of predicted toxin-antitoxin system